MKIVIYLENKGVEYHGMKVYGVDELRVILTKPGRKLIDWEIRRMNNGY